MRQVSPLTNSGAKRAVWQIFCDYANGGGVEAYWRLLRKQNFMLWARPAGKDVDRRIPGATAKERFAEKVSKERKEASLLLHWLADPPGHTAEKPRVVAILNDHLAHSKRAFGAFPGGAPSPANANQLEMAPEFVHPIDMICDTIADHLTHHGSVAAVEERPLRICRLCTKLFVPQGRRKFCPGEKCRATFYNRRSPVDAARRYEYRVMALRKKLGAKAFQIEVDKRLARIQRGQLTPEKERRIVFLKRQQRPGTICPDFAPNNRDATQRSRAEMHGNKRRL